MHDPVRFLDFPVTPPPAAPGAVPSFDLYGEAAPRPRLDPVHAEPLAFRSARHAWTIRPHRHARLHQIFWIRAGGGTLLGDGPERAFRAPALHLVPAGRIHGFRYDPASAGHVLTLEADFAADCARLGGAWLPEAVATLSPAPPLAAGLDAAFERLDAAFREAGPGRGAALAGHVLLLAGLLRSAAPPPEAEAGGATAQALLVRRFRAEVEAGYRDHAGLDLLCRRLGVTRSTLTRACRAVTGRPPLGLVQDRLLAEARRMLTHGDRPVSGVAYALGFEPAYFSRFFARHEGVTPSAYRQRHGG